MLQALLHVPAPIVWPTAPLMVQAITQGPTQWCNGLCHTYMCYWLAKAQPSAQ